MPLPDDSTRDVPKQEPTVVLPEVGPQRDTAAGGQVTGSFASGQEPLLLSGEHSAHWPIIPGYEIQRELGRGGMGVVYEARQVALKRTVALKMIRTGSQAGPEERARFKTEAETIARLQHPNIVQIHEIGEVDGQAFYALEFVPGGSLARELAGAVLPPRQAAELVATLAQAMHVAHQAGVIHRDLKPANVLLAAQRVPKVTDFGLAKQMDDPAGPTQSGQILGTPSYMAPEQASGRPGEIGPATDIYALGAILYECLTGRPPFKGATMLETLEQVRSDEPVSPSQLQPRIPRDLVTICLKCLHKEPRRRYATAAALADDLGRFLRGEPVSAQPPSLLYLTGKLARRYRIPFSVVTVVLIVLIGGTAVAFLGIDSERRAALDANHKLDDANRQLEDQLYDNRIAVAERELTLRQDIGLATDLLQLCPKRLRGWEWDYLMRLRDGAREPLVGHKAGLWTALFSPDGTQIATASIDGTAKIWNARTGKEIFTYSGHVIPFAPRIPVTCLAYSPDGKHIASASLFPDLFDITNARKAFGVIKVWDAISKQEIAKYDTQIGLVYCLAYSPDGNRISSSHINDEKLVAVWDARTGKEIHLIRDNPSHVHGLRYSPDGRFLLAGCTDGSIRIWKADTLELVRNLDAHGGPVYGLAFSLPDGARFASASVDGTIRVWDTATADPVMKLRGHTGAAMGVAFSPDGQRIASAGYDKTIRLWDAATGKEKITLRGHTDLVGIVAYRPDGQQLVSASFDKEARIWDISPAPAPEGAGLFTLGGHTDRVNAIAFSRDGRLLASAGWDTDIRLWDGKTGEALRTFKGHHGAIWGVALSPDGKLLASASWDRTLKIWDTETGNELRAFTGHGAPVHGVAFSPDGERLVSTSWDGLVKICNPRTGKETLTYAGHLMPTMAVAFSPDGKRIASGGGDRTVRVWNADNGQDLFTLKGHEGLVHSVAFSQDGTRIASASWDHTVKVWDAKTGKELRTFKGHSDRVQCVAFSPDSKRIASVSEDKTLRVWDAATGVELQPPCHYHGVLYSVSFNDDGKRVAVGGWAASGWVKTWMAE